MNEDFLRELKDSAEDAEIIEDSMSSVETTAGTINYSNALMDYFSSSDLDPKTIEIIKCLEEKRFNKQYSHSTKRGNNPKAIKARRKKNKNKKTHRK